MKKINPELIEILENSGLHSGDCVCYLLSLFLNLEVTYIPDGLKQKVHALNIVTFTDGNYSWNISLFENLDMGMDWVVEEYLPLFKPFAKDKKYKRECITRMQDFLYENAEVSKELVLEATELYIRTCKKERRQAKFVTNPHYFIQKGTGVSKTNPLLTYVDLIKEDKSPKAQGRISTSITMK